MMMIRPGVSTTPSRTFNKPDSDNRSGSSLNKDAPKSLLNLLLLLTLFPPAPEVMLAVELLGLSSTMPTADSFTGGGATSAGTETEVGGDTTFKEVFSPINSSTNVSSTVPPFSNNVLIASAWDDKTLSNLSFKSFRLLKKSMASSHTRVKAESLLPAAPTIPRAGMEVIRCAMSRKISDLIAFASFSSRGHFSESSLTTSWHPLDWLSRNILQSDLGVGRSICATSTAATLRPSRRLTTSEAASTSSMT
mmetsp:Transcript_92458/g.138477  ORF Transcript_92458/g.138477 Transcript_92458/m.138477 type:complete len:250 (+) Transcript_92458:441-1190(+)